MRTLRVGCWMLAVLLAWTAAHAQNASVSFPVDSFVISYGRPHPAAPSIDAIADTTVELVRSGSVYSADGTGIPVTVRLGDPLPAGSQITEAGLLRILEAAVAAINKGGVYGALAFPSRDQIDLQTHEDLRAPGDKSLKVVIWLTEVAQVRTVAKGDRLKGKSGIMSPVHARIRENSPLVAANDGEPGSLIFKDRLDDYLRRLNRQPGRRVEAAISSTDQPGRVVLDYLVSENRPWFVYGQLSNTGTEATDQFRERFGFVHNQLFSRDDILSVDYITAAFNTANAAFLSYSIPVIYPDKLRARVFGSWGDFDATVELAGLTSGLGGSQENFTGSSWSAGAELIWSPITLWGASIDIAGGAAMPHYEVFDSSTGAQGKADLLTPYITLRAERATELFRLAASLGYEGSFKQVARADLERLGRLRVQDTYDMVRFELNASTYLEPLFAGYSRRDRWGVKPLAHEAWFQARVQRVVGGDRMIPQKEQAIGGFFSVRGYPESAIAGDNTMVANLEYRFHLPRVLQPTSEINKDRPAATIEPAPTLFGRPFNYRPPRVAARPDWDLVLRLFFDYGKVEVNEGNPPRSSPTEQDHTLMSAGVGAEMQLLRNFNARVDLGYTMKDLRAGIPATVNSEYIPGPNDTDKGDTRLHFLLTFVW